MIIIKAYLIGCAISLIFTVISMISGLRDEIREKGVVKVSLDDICAVICTLIFCTSISWGFVILFLCLTKDVTIFTLKGKNHDKNRD